MMQLSEELPRIIWKIRTLVDAMLTLEKATQARNCWKTESANCSFEVLAVLHWDFKNLSSNAHFCHLLSYFPLPTLLCLYSRSPSKMNYVALLITVHTIQKLKNCRWSQMMRLIYVWKHFHLPYWRWPLVWCQNSFASMKKRFSSSAALLWCRLFPPELICPARAAPTLLVYT